MMVNIILLILQYYSFKLFLKYFQYNFFLKKF